jgi:predicted porin
MGAALLVAGVPALAQSSVTLYGQIGSGLTYKNHQTGGNSVGELADNLLSASNFGVRGVEDLGGGIKAQFRLESGVAVANGVAGATVGTVSKFWNRQANVGLDLGGAGTLTLGRQFHAHTDRAIQALDVYNLAGSSVHVVPLALFGVNRFVGNDSRIDSGVKYRLNGPAGLTGAVSAALNDNGNGRSWSADIGQTTNSYRWGIYAVEFQAPTVIAATGVRPKHRVWGLGGQVPFGDVKLFAHLMDSKLDATVAGRGVQTNQVLSLGVAWQATPSTTLKAAYYDDRGKVLNGVAGRDGKKTTLVLSAEYALSKRTSLYGAAFENRFSDGYKLEAVNIAALARDPAAASTQGVSAGLRHAF